MKSFRVDNWAAEIAKTTTDKEYQSVEIEILDPNASRGDYDRETATWARPVVEPLYKGQARIIQVSRGVQNKGDGQANPHTYITTRVQLPHGALPVRVKRGTPVYVTSAPNNRALETMVFRVTSDMQGGSTASRTFEVAADGDAER